jgi:ATP-dependent RNA helicase RhlE
LHKLGQGKPLHLLPLLKLYKFTPGHTPLVILVPTRELLVQVVEEVEKLTNTCRFELWVFWGCAILPKTTVYTGCDILVGTPE